MPMPIDMPGLPRTPLQPSEKPVFIIGGGPSLTGFNFQRLFGKNVIAVNRAVFDCPWAQYFITHDLAFFKKLNYIELEFLRHLSLTKIFVRSNINEAYTEISGGRIYDRRPYPDAPAGYTFHLDIVNIVILSKYEEGMGFNFGSFRHGENSGFCALQFAVLEGFNPVYLLGFDMRVDTGRSHYHNGFGENPEAVQKRLDYYIHNFQMGINELKARSGRQVFSCSPVSRLNDFIEYRNIGEALRDG